MPLRYQVEIDAQSQVNSGPYLLLLQLLEPVSKSAADKSSIVGLNWQLPTVDTAGGALQAEDPACRICSPMSSIRLPRSTNSERHGFVLAELPVPP